MESEGPKSPENAFTTLTRHSASARMLFFLGSAHSADPSGNWKSMFDGSRVILGFVQLSQYFLPFLPPCNSQIRKASLEDKKSYLQVCAKRSRTRPPSRPAFRKLGGKPRKGNHSSVIAAATAQQLFLLSHLQDKCCHFPFDKHVAVTPPKSPL